MRESRRSSSSLRKVMFDFRSFFSLSQRTDSIGKNKKNTMEALSRSHSVDERSVAMGQDVDGDSVRERSVHGGSFSREASFRGGNANDRSFRGGRGGDRDQDRSVHSTTSAVPPSSSSRPPLPKNNNKNGINDDEVELGHHHGLSVAARPAAAAPPGAASASSGLAPAPPAPPHAKFYLEEYDHDLYGAPLWAWPRVSRRRLFWLFFFFFIGREKARKRASERGKKQFTRERERKT